MNIKRQLIGGGLLLLIFLNLFNFLNYFFHFFMARMLTLTDYGIFASLMSLAYLFNIPSESIQLIASKYTSFFSERKNLAGIRTVFSKLINKSFKLGIVMYILFIPIAYLISIFLRIKYGLVLITGLILPLTFLVPINRGILQGEKKFGKLGVLFFIEGTTKILLGVLLVLLGFKVYGALGGVILGLLVSFLFSFGFIKNILCEKPGEKIKLKNPYSYGLKVFIMMSIVFIMLSLDVFLARRFFNEELVGIYAVASLLGKTIFFAITPISKAMFPLTSGVSKKKSRPTLLYSIKISLILGVLALLIFSIIPKFTISILFGAKYVSAAPILWIIGLSFLILTFVNLIIFYLLSLKSIHNVKIFLLLPLVEIILLSLFHKNLVEFSIALLASFCISFLITLFMVKNGKD